MWYSQETNFTHHMVFYTEPSEEVIFGNCLERTVTLRKYKVLYRTDKKEIQKQAAEHFDPCFHSSSNEKILSSFDITDEITASMLISFGS